MGDSSNQSSSSLLDSIVHEDWPLLKELENTKFSLKNKRNANVAKTMESMKDASEKEDSILRSQNQEDEKMVDAFLGETQNLQKEEVNNKIYDRSEVESEKPIIKTENIKVERVQNTEKYIENTDVSKLVAKGLGKVYIEKTDHVLSPLRFLLENYKSILIGVMQFIIPAFITWLLISYFEPVRDILSTETNHTTYLYIGIFYFACLFLSITSQVLASGIYNVFKMIIGILAKQAKE